MLFEQVGSVYSIVINLAGLIVCLFQYIKRPTKAGVCVLVYLLSNLLSNYYWGAYVVVMGDYPNVSSILSYVGWNIVQSLMVAASPFGGDVYQFMRASIILTAIGCKDVIGKQDNASAEKIFDKIMGSKFR